MSTDTSRFDRIRWNDVTFEGARSLVFLFIVGMSVLPVIYILLAAFKPPEEFFTTGVHWFPENPTLQAWEEGWEVLQGPLQRSAAIAIGTTIVTLAITIPTAYAFARREFPGRKGLFYLIAVVLLFPYIVLIVPIVDMWFTFNIYNTIPGTWLAYQVFVAPFAIWILRDFFAQLPVNLEEAAQVYGCTPLTAFLRVILPLSLPGVVAVGFIAFLISWNDYLFANMLLQANRETAIVALFKSTQGGERTYWGRLMAETLIIGTPPTVLYMLAKRQLTSAFSL